MLSLESRRWSDLQHAYGQASDIPALLKQLADVPDSSDNKEPWFTLWSSLAHQGDVYSASFAAVPHIVAALASAPLKADFTYFQFPAWVEICRKKGGVPVPEDIAPSYFEALSRLPLPVNGIPPFCLVLSRPSLHQKAKSWLLRQFRSYRRKLPRSSCNGSSRDKPPNPAVEWDAPPIAVAPLTFTLAFTILTSP